jgi:thiol-disulfide isomerase/thioredoxin
MQKYGWLIMLLLVGGYYLGRYVYFLPTQAAGELAPNFSAVLHNGADFELAQLRGDFVLLDFWGSWCGPCRAESPALRALYERFKGRKNAAGAGFTIVSVGVEKSAARWRAAISADGRDWPYHILDTATNLRFFDGAIADQYGVKAVPTHFLLDPTGQIVAVDPSVEELSALLAKKLPN